MPRDILTRRGSRIGIVARDHKAIWCTAAMQWLICTHDKHCSATPRNDVCAGINIGDGGTWPAAQPWPVVWIARTNAAMPVCLRGWRQFAVQNSSNRDNTPNRSFSCPACAWRSESARPYLIIRTTKLRCVLSRFHFHVEQCIIELEINFFEIPQKCHRLLKSNRFSSRTRSVDLIYHCWINVLYMV